MAPVVFVLGAGFSRSVVDSSFRNHQAPLARDFFQVLLGPGRLREQLDAIRQRVYVDDLIATIEEYWHLSLEDLEAAPFDIEECLTFLESQAAEAGDDESRLRPLRAAYALRALLLGYLSEISLTGAYNPVAARFGSDVLGAGADVLTFNYDTLAEAAIESASGIGPNPKPPPTSSAAWDEPVPDDFLSASHYAWKRTLACGFQFDELALPVAGISRYVDGQRYYSHPDNAVYDSRRVLKLHGSIDWLRYTPRRVIPAEYMPDAPADPPPGLVQERFAHWWLGEPPQRQHWYMDPLIVAPQLYKTYTQPPLPTVWQSALETLRSCRALVVIGYSFPPTDFRTRRLFLEAFSGSHALGALAVINPDTRVVGTVRELTRYAGPVVTCDNLGSYYGVPTPWFDPEIMVTPADKEAGSEAST